MLLKDMGAVIGEVENLESTEAINLNIKIEE